MMLYQADVIYDMLIRQSASKMGNITTPQTSYLAAVTVKKACVLTVHQYRYTNRAKPHRISRAGMFIVHRFAALCCVAKVFILLIFLVRLD